MTTYYEEHLAAWAVVFPRDGDVALPNPDAELLTVLEGALRVLRERGCPLSDTEREDVRIRANSLMRALGRIDWETGA
jgi:hypothetical protein